MLRLDSRTKWIAGGVTAAVTILGLSFLVFGGGASDSSRALEPVPTRAATPLVRQRPTPTRSASPTSTPTSTSAPSPVETEVPAPTPVVAEAISVPAEVEPPPQAEPTPVPPPPPPAVPPPSLPPAPTSPPEPTPLLQAGEAKALAMDWLVELGGEWVGSSGILLPPGTLGIFLASVLLVDTCTNSWEDGRWTISCEIYAGCFGWPDACRTTYAGIAHIWVYETTLTVTWAEPALTD